MTRWYAFLIIFVLVIPSTAYSQGNDVKTMFLWVENSIDRIGKYDEVSQQDSIHLYSARNGWGDFN